MTTQRFGKNFLLGLGLTLLLAQSGFAAQTQVGTEEERLRRPKQVEVPERAVVPIEIPPEEELPAAAVGAAPITVTRCALERATLLPDQEFQRLCQPVINKTVTLRELQKVALAVTRWYRGRGYVTSRALVPAQSVERGLVRVRVIEGKVGQIKIAGNKYFSTELLRRYLQVKPGEILWLPRIEEGLVQLNANPDRKVKLVLTPAAQPETTDLLLQVSDKDPFHASYAVDTLGTKETGLVRQSVVVSHGNFTGNDDQISARGIGTEFGGLWGGVLSYLRPLTPSGITGTFDVSGVRTSLGQDLKGLLARGEAETIAPGLIFPLAHHAAWGLEAATGFDFKRVRTFRDDRVNSKDDLRVPHIGTNLLEEDKYGRSLFLQELRMGVPNVLGASHPEDPAASRATAGGSFVRWIVNLARLQQGPWGTSLLWRGSAQLTTDRLVPSEQFRLGGFDTVRGYPEGEFLADSGYQSTIELRGPLGLFVPGPSGGKSFLARARRSFLLVGFWDFAEGFTKAPIPGEDADERLSSLGCGFRLRPTAESVVQADFGWPIGDRDAEKDRPRIHLICRIGF